MRRLIVVDQTLRDFVGHHAEYTGAVARAARDSGLEAVILAHKELQTSVSNFAEGTVLPWFSGGSYAATRGLMLRRIGYKGLALAPQPLQKTLFHLVHWAGRQAFQWRLPWKHSKTHRTGAENPHDFGCGMMKAFRKLRIEPSEHVLVHTLSVGELHSLLDALAEIDVGQMPRLHIVLRRDPREPSVRQRPRGGISGALQRTVATGLWPARIRFYCDTEKLRRQYEAIVAVRFGVVPIAFDPSLVAPEPRTKPTDCPLTAVYLGDARVEKGYTFLPNLVAALYDRYVATGRLRFDIQSNYNVPGGEPGIALARKRLAAYGPDRVRLRFDALSAEEYYGVLANADIVLLPYDADLYRNRSSGILAQALAAGKPVVVSAGTWMADEIDLSRGRTFTSPDDLATVTAEVVEHYSAMVCAASAFSANWRKKHNAHAFLKVILD